MQTQARSSSPKSIKKQTMAEQVAAAIREEIIAGEWQAGDLLPTEPEIGEIYGVSRAVVRDATRMLAAQGLVVAQHGRGVFVTPSQTAAFGDALLLALRRAGASVWDVEQFEQSVFPTVCRLAAVQATDAEIQAMGQAAASFMERFEAMTSLPSNSSQDTIDAARQATMDAYTTTMGVIFAATHNQLWSLLAQPLARLRNLRQWGPPDEPTPENVASAVAQEATYFQEVIGAIANRDPDHAERVVTELMGLPPQAIEAMQQTPVGEIPQIPGTGPADR
jgi:DNA-binding FadR family transcriptional regulator